MFCNYAWWLVSHRKVFILNPNNWFMCDASVDKAGLIVHPCDRTVGRTEDKLLRCQTKVIHCIGSNTLVCNCCPGFSLASHRRPSGLFLNNTTGCPSQNLSVLITFRQFADWQHFRAPQNWCRAKIKSLIRDKSLTTWLNGLLDFWLVSFNMEIYCDYIDKFTCNTD